MLSVDELQTLHDSGEIDTVIVGFTDHYGRLMGKRFDSGFFLEEGVSSGTHACDYLLTVDVEMEPVPGYTFASWQMGYGDFHLVPDMATLRVASWLPRTAMVLCDLADTETHEPVSVGPRSILSRQVAKATKMGFEVAAASELEFFIFKDSYRKAKKKGYAGLKPAGLYVEDYDLFSGGRVEEFVGAARRHLRDSGVPVENSKGEWGLGQHELNVRYTDILTMADRHTVFKHCLKGIAEDQDISVSFMAKPHTEGAGNSCHVHFQRVPLVPRRMDEARLRRHGVLRPHHQLVQAVSGRLVGAHRYRLGPRQSHGWLSSGRLRCQPPNRMSNPRC